MIRRCIVALFLAAALWAPGAQAFQPEDGLWWNPAQSGRGLVFEVQDNLLLVTTYVYLADGRAVFYTSAGPLVYTYNNQGSLLRVTYNGQLDAASNGQCIGCTYRPPIVTPGAGGPIAITFRTETSADLTWGGATTPIERFSALGSRTARMLGEWQAVIDFYDRGNTSGYPYRDYPFFGDVLLVDGQDNTRNPPLFLGCRPANTGTRCTAAARRDHDVAGFYNNNNDETVIVVKDTPGTVNSAATYFAYFVNAGLNQFDGVLSIYREGGNPEAGPFYAVRGFRSASKTYAQTGVGPASADDKAAAGVSGGMTAHLIDAAGNLPAGMDAAAAQAHTGIDVASLATQVPVLIAAMKKRNP